MTDGPKQLFEQFQLGGLAHIEKTVDEQWHESLLLDFKAAASNAGPMQPEDRKNLGKSLSGFGNSEGGIVVWGVRADQQQPDEPDVAKELKPIKKLSVFVSDLQNNTAQIVSPPIVGVEHQAIYSDKTNDIGYVVTYVPKIDSDPSMSMAKDEHRFYCRSGASFIPMEGYMLSDRFHRVVRPVLEITWKLKHGGVDRLFEPRTSKVDVIVGIRNIGKAPATYPSLGLGLPPQCGLHVFGLDGNYNHGLPEQVIAPDTRRPLRAHLFGGGAEHVVYPQFTREVTTITIIVPYGACDAEDVSIEYEIHAIGASKAGEITINGTELIDCLNS